MKHIDKWFFITDYKWVHSDLFSRCYQLPRGCPASSYYSCRQWVDLDAKACSPQGGKFPLLWSCYVKWHQCPYLQMWGVAILSSSPSGASDGYLDLGPRKRSEWLCHRCELVWLLPMGMRGWARSPTLPGGLSQVTVGVLFITHSLQIFFLNQNVNASLNHWDLRLEYWQQLSHYFSQ